MNETSKIGVIGAGFLTVIGAAIAISQMAPDVTVTNNSTAAAPPAPVMSKDVAGMLVDAAVVQLEGDGFSINSKETLTIEPYGPAEYCTGAP